MRIELNKNDDEEVIFDFNCKHIPLRQYLVFILCLLYAFTLLCCFKLKELYYFEENGANNCPAPGAAVAGFHGPQFRLLGHGGRF